MSSSLETLESSRSEEALAKTGLDRKHVDLLKAGGERCLNIGADYCRSWKAPQGFREIYQNWDDGMKESNKLEGITSIKPPLNDRGFVGNAALHPDTRQEFGYLRLSETTGVLEMTNYKAQLSAKSLGIGATSKSGSKHYAGQHGEGYKIAALALLREGYGVTIKSTNCELKFYIGLPGTKYEGLLCVYVTRKKDEELQPLKDAYAQRIADGLTRLHRGHIWQDVTVRIGGEGKKVTMEDFNSWTKFALDLDPPSKIITTTRGSLLLDERFGGKVFLKGILLEGGSVSEKLKFGYNFAEGEVERDRTRLKTYNEQAWLVAQIWEEVIQKEPKMVAEYLEMLENDPEPGDVAGANITMSQATARAIWTHLLKNDPDREYFFYAVQNGIADLNIITNSLGKKPTPLKTAIWNTLRKYDLVQTPQEWRKHLLATAPTSTLKDTVYSKGIKRGLIGILNMDPRTRTRELVFKARDNAELDLIVDDSRILVNDAWLDFDKSHRSRCCDLLSEALNQQVSIDTFECGHVICELYDFILSELSRLPNVHPLASNNFLRQQVGEKIRQTPSNVEVAQGEHAGEINVSWIEFESDRVFKKHGLLWNGRVTLHRESTCADTRHAILSPTKEDTPQSKSFMGTACGCPEQVIPLKDSLVIFGELSENEKYFPMISRDSSQSFYGLPPPAIQPAALADAPPIAQKDLTASVYSLALAPKDEIKHGIIYEDLYGASSAGDKDEEDNTNSDTETSAPQSAGTSTQGQHNAPNGGHFRQGPHKRSAVIPANFCSGAASILLPARLQTPHANEIEKDADAEIEESTLRAELEIGGANLESLRIEVSRLTAENQNLTLQLQAAHNSREKAEHQFHNAQTELNLGKEEHAANHQRLEKAMNLAKENENLQRDCQDAEGTVMSLRAQIQQLRSENQDLAAKLEQAENDLDDQVRVAGNLATRRKGASSRVKREREEQPEEEKSNNASPRKNRKDLPLRLSKTKSLTSLEMPDTRPALNASSHRGTMIFHSGHASRIADCWPLWKTASMGLSRAKRQLSRKINILDELDLTGNVFLSLVYFLLPHIQSQLLRSSTSGQQAPIPPTLKHRPFPPLQACSSTKEGKRI